MLPHRGAAMGHGRALRTNASPRRTVARKGARMRRRVTAQHFHPGSSLSAFHAGCAPRPEPRSISLRWWPLRRSDSMVEASVVHTIAWLVALAFVGLAVGVSVHLILAHHRHFVRPIYQRKIVGILWMVPIYAADSWISLRFPAVSIYLDLLRDMYEAYVIYLFMALMIAYLGAGDEGRVVSILEGKPPVRPSPLARPRAGLLTARPPDSAHVAVLPPAARRHGRILPPHLQIRRHAVRRPQASLHPRRPRPRVQGRLRRGRAPPKPVRRSPQPHPTAPRAQHSLLHASSGYPYLAFIMNASITYAFYWLAMFYLALKKELGAAQRLCTPPLDCAATFTHTSFPQPRFRPCPSSSASRPSSS